MQVIKESMIKYLGLNRLRIANLGCTLVCGACDRAVQFKCTKLDNFISVLWKLDLSETRLSRVVKRIAR